MGSVLFSIVRLFNPSIHHCRHLFSSVILVTLALVAVLLVEGSKVCCRKSSECSSSKLGPGQGSTEAEEQEHEGGVLHGWAAGVRLCPDRLDHGFYREQGRGSTPSLQVASIGRHNCGSLCRQRRAENLSEHPNVSVLGPAMLLRGSPSSRSHSKPVMLAKFWLI